MYTTILFKSILIALALISMATIPRLDKAEGIIFAAWGGL
jgi:hypothetical protein